MYTNRGSAREPHVMMECCNLGWRWFKGRPAHHCQCLWASRVSLTCFSAWRGVFVISQRIYLWPNILKGSRPRPVIVMYCFNLRAAARRGNCMRTSAVALLQHPNAIGPRKSKRRRPVRYRGHRRRCGRDAVHWASHLVPRVPFTSLYKQNGSLLYKHYPAGSSAPPPENYNPGRLHLRVHLLDHLHI